MLDIKDMRCLNDLLYIDGIYKKLQKHEQDFYIVLDALLNISTLLPMCYTQYGEGYEEFRKYEKVYTTLMETIESLKAYDVEVKLPRLLQDKLDSLFSGGKGNDDADN